MDFRDEMKAAAGSEGARRATGDPAAGATGIPDPAVDAKPTRRRFSAEYKLRILREVERPNPTVHFVTDGVEGAVKQARAAAGRKSVGVHGAETIQQLLNAGLLDEIHIDIAAVLLGSGVRLFDHLACTPAVLGNPTVIQGVGVTHLRYPVRNA